MKNKGESESKGEFTIDPDAIEKGILESAEKGDPNNPDAQTVDPVAIQRIVAAGMKLLFDKETHGQLFKGINTNDDIPLEYELGKGGAGLMLIMYKESGQSMPVEAIIPAGAILLAKACEFIDETNLAPVTDQTYGDALEMMIAELEKEFAAAEAGGAQPEGASGEAMPGAEQPGGQQPGGMLRQQGGGAV